jgi:transposase
VGSRRDCTWILGLPGFRVERVDGEDGDATSRVQIRIERRGVRRYPCSGCGRRTRRVRSTRDRMWDDLPWAAHPVTLIYRQRRVQCRRCGIRTERIEFADPKARVIQAVRGLMRHLHRSGRVCENASQTAERVTEFCPARTVLHSTRTNAEEQ